MTRVYFNGVGNINSNGKTISFILEDTIIYKNGEKQKKVISELITEVNTAEEIFKFLLEEINKIKSIDNSKISNPEKPQRNKKNITEKLGRKIAQTNILHPK